MCSFFRRIRNRTTSGSPANEDQPPSYGSLGVFSGAVTNSDKDAEGIVRLFYRIYNEDGGIPSKVPLDSNNPYLACINGHLVAPPHTAASIKRCICRIERIASKDQDVELFDSALKKAPMDDDEYVAILEGTGPGSSPKEPLALVCKGVPVGEFKVKLKAIVPWGYTSAYPEWIGYQKGEVLWTDGVRREATYANNTKYHVYRARNAAGRVGCAYRSSVLRHFIVNAHERSLFFAYIQGLRCTSCHHVMAS